MCPVGDVPQLQNAKTTPQIRKRQLLKPKSHYQSLSIFAGACQDREFFLWQISKNFAKVANGSAHLRGRKMRWTFM